MRSSRHLPIAPLSVAVIALASVLSIRAITPESSFDSPREHEPIKPIPLESNLDHRIVELGRRLFHDPILSHDNTVSCASCHDLNSGGTDHQKHSVGINLILGSINAPTVLNCGANFKQFWDGHAASLEEQIDGPIQSPFEMGSNWPQIAKKLHSTHYDEDFRRLYRDGIQPANIKNAIATFERSLFTPNCRFDKYLRGDNHAITREEQEGYHKFKSYGCSSCHQGVNIGGNMFQAFGTMGDYFADRGNLSHSDYGRFNVTGKESDRYVFKVPTLRNVALSAPYFHDGSAATLEDAVAIMAKYQLGLQLPPSDIAQIVTFLRTLTGELNGKPL